MDPGDVIVREVVALFQGELDVGAAALFLPKRELFTPTCGDPLDSARILQVFRRRENKRELEISELISCAVPRYRGSAKPQVPL